MQLSFQFQMNEKEKVICEFEMNFKKSFCLRSFLNEDDKISSEIRSGFRELERHPPAHQEFPGVPPGKEWARRI